MIGWTNLKFYSRLKISSNDKLTVIFSRLPHEKVFNLNASVTDFGKFESEFEQVNSSIASCSLKLLMLHASLKPSLNFETLLLLVLIRILGSSLIQPIVYLSLILPNEKCKTASSEP